MGCLNVKISIQEDTRPNVILEPKRPSFNITYEITGSTITCKLVEICSILWQAVDSCFGAGYWVNSKAWKNQDAWKNK